MPVIMTSGAARRGGMHAPLSSTYYVFLSRVHRGAACSKSHHVNGEGGPAILVDFLRGQELRTRDAEEVKPKVDPLLHLQNIQRSA